MPRMTIEEVVGEGLRVHQPELDASQRQTRVLAALAEQRGGGAAEVPAESVAA